MASRRQISGIPISHVRLKNINLINCAGFILNRFARAVKKICYKRKHRSATLNGDYSLSKTRPTHKQHINSKPFICSL